MVPQVAMRKVLHALRLDDITVVAVGLHKDVLQCLHLGQVRNGCPLVRIGKPDAVTGAEA